MEPPAGGACVDRSEGFTKLLFDPETKQILGGAIVGTNAGDLIGEVALAIEMNCVAADIGLTIHPHPTLAETVDSRQKRLKAPSQICTSRKSARSGLAQDR